MKFFTFIFVSFFSLIATANVAIFKFENELQEKRFKVLVAELRCPTCQNQNLADSNSMVAEDLKQIVYEQIIAGKTDEQILSFMKQRYGEFILYEPEIQSNIILWVGPFIFLVLALTGFLIWYKNNKVESSDD
ncbi:cytochrome c-type biogenesis protein CcmH [Aliikangiella marina]|uniref:Cytochrome c-type biogenesis protein n=1 Tax=Aliikangiella marina TaxID=1712262 RepID=A0A545T2I9_9GAMM|nr:cytochrome c-type biogenesis protein [Aliikangiella marina]TQV71431.1 cytochrome c-type biogenesis protein CcmH [Aliikangiella marina]